MYKKKGMLFRDKSYFGSLEVTRVHTQITYKFNLLNQINVTSFTT